VNGGMTLRPVKRAQFLQQSESVAAVTKMRVSVMGVLGAFL